MADVRGLRRQAVFARGYSGCSVGPAGGESRLFSLALFGCSVEPSKAWDGVRLFSSVSLDGLTPARSMTEWLVYDRSFSP